MAAYLITVAIVCITGLLADLFRAVSRMHAATDEGRASHTRAIPPVSGLFVWVAAIVLVGMAGFRWMIGTDYLRYTQNYYMYRDGLTDALKTFDEPGIRALALLGSFINDEPSIMFFMASVLTVGLAIVTLAKSGAPLAFSLLLFIFVGSWHESFNVVRQSIAVSIVFAGHGFIIERKFVKYLFIVMLASLFHISALAAILLYWVPTRKFGLKGFAVLAVGVLAAVAGSGLLLSGVISITNVGEADYLTREVNILRLLMAVAPLTLYVVTLAADTQHRSRSAWFYNNMALIFVAATLPLMFSVYMYRFTHYIVIFLPLILSSLTDFRSEPARLFTRGGIVVLYGIVWYFTVSTSPDLNPYMSVLD